MKELEYFKYGQKEMSYLKSKDRLLGNVIDRVGFIRREVMPDTFKALVFNIVGQQISPKAAQTVNNRITALLNNITPSTVFGASADELCACGLSGRKVGYIKGIADRIINDRLDLADLNNLSDKDIIKALTALPGIGIWTAEMLMIFSMQRPDIISYGDSAIRRGMKRVYLLDELTLEQFNIYRSSYSPYGTVASFYLWAASKGD